MDSTWSPMGAISAGIFAAPVVAAVLYWAFGPPVSMPGPPKKNRDLRVAEWPTQDAEGPGDGWTFLTADRAHEFTKAHLGEDLTGEPAGRHLWYRAGEDAGCVRLQEGHSDLSPRSRSNGGSPSRARTLQTLFGTSPKHNQRELDQRPAFCAHRNPNAGDRIFRRQRIKQWMSGGGRYPNEDEVPASPLDAARKGIEYYQMLQCEDGHWAGDYGGPHFLLPGLVCTFYITNAPMQRYHQDGFVAYIRSHQQCDGGWGTHIEGASTMFGTVLNYVALRLLGVPAEDPACIRGREHIRRYGGALYTTSWAKFWLALLGLYEWKGIASIPPEMWLLPRWFPFHPGRLWCHCRMVYLPMCYLYGNRFCLDASKDPLLMSLRQEIYCTNYDRINWLGYLHAVAPQDNYSPITLMMRAAHWLLVVYEELGPFTWLRKKGLEFSARYMAEEDKQTNFIDIGPVNKSLNMLSCWLIGGRKETPEFRQHLARVDDYLWLAEDGLKMNGYNGSQCWDTSFAIQGMVESGLARDFPEMSRKVWMFLDNTQIKVNEDDNEYWYRHISKGGWPFSTAAHGWPISDCTGEGLKGVLALRTLECIESMGKHTIDLERMYDAVNVLLSYQNHDGGWATYENNRGYGWYEWLNPSEAFGDIMIDYSYVECSSASMTALIDFRKQFPDHRAKEIALSIQRGRAFLKSIQRRDGSWYGSWGVCFTYGTWFGIKGLVSSGEPRSSWSIVQAVKFILSHQRENGGWGETYLSCSDKAYTGNGAGRYGVEGSGVVQTAWACLGLMHALMEIEIDTPAPGTVLIGEENHGMPEAVAENALQALKRGIAWLMQRQLASGDWSQESCTGVFNRSCAITYTAYRNIFPIWALGLYGRYFPVVEEEDDAM